MTAPLTVVAAAEFLGISETSLRRTMRERLIPFCQPPHGPATFELADLVAFRAAHRRDAVQPETEQGSLHDFSIAIAKKNVDARRAARGGAR